MVSDWLVQLRSHRLIAVLRSPALAQAEQMAAAVVRAGIFHLEVTCDSDRPFELIQRLRRRWPFCSVGAGTVLYPAQLSQAIAAGASFGFSPVLDESLLKLAIAAGFPLIAGGLTPSEIWQAWQWGAPAVKVFPIEALGGATYLRHLSAPLANIPLVPTGGVSLDNAPKLLAAGAWAVCLGNSLFPPALVAQQDWATLESRAKALVDQVQSQEIAAPMPTGDRLSGRSAVNSLPSPSRPSHG